MPMVYILPVWNYSVKYILMILYVVCALLYFVGQGTNRFYPYLCASKANMFDMSKNSTSTENKWSYNHIKTSQIKPLRKYCEIYCICQIGVHISGVLCQKQLSRAERSNYIPQIVLLLVPALDTCFWHNTVQDGNFNINLDNALYSICIHGMSCMARSTNTESAQ